MKKIFMFCTLMLLLVACSEENKTPLVQPSPFVGYWVEVTRYDIEDHELNIPAKATAAFLKSCELDRNTLLLQKGQAVNIESKGHCSHTFRIDEDLNITPVTPLGSATLSSPLKMAIKEEGQAGRIDLATSTLIENSSGKRAETRVISSNLLVFAQDEDIKIPSHPSIEELTKNRDYGFLVRIVFDEGQIYKTLENILLNQIRTISKAHAKDLKELEPLKDKILSHAASCHKQKVRIGINRVIGHSDELIDGVVNLTTAFKDQNFAQAVCEGKKVESFQLLKSVPGANRAYRYNSLGGTLEFYSNTQSTDIIEAATQ